MADQQKTGEKMEYKHSFVLYESVYTQYKRYVNKGHIELAAAFIESVMRYGLYEEVPEDGSDIWDYGFDNVIATISAAKSKYNKKIQIPEADLRALLDSGYNQKEIAEFYQCSVDTIQRRIKEYGIKAENRKTPQAIFNENANVNEKDNLYDNGN